MLIKNFILRLNILKSNGVDIQNVLDIGAYRGDFTETIKTVYPDAHVIQIEADDRQKMWLDDTAIICLLGNKEQDKVPFYTLDENVDTTGSSIFLEQTPYYNESSTIVYNKNMTTLDALHQKHNFSGDWLNHGFVKIDTQGSELLILDGAVNFLETKKPRFMLLECSVQEYNKGAPKLISVIEYMHKLKYEVVDLYDLAYDGVGKLLQTDLLFERTSV